MLERYGAYSFCGSFNSFINKVLAKGSGVALCMLVMIAAAIRLTRTADDTFD